MIQQLCMLAMLSTSLAAMVWWSFSSLAVLTETPIYKLGTWLPRVKPAFSSLPHSKVWVIWLTRQWDGSWKYNFLGYTFKGTLCHPFINFPASTGWSVDMKDLDYGAFQSSNIGAWAPMALVQSCDASQNFKCERDEFPSHLYHSNFAFLSYISYPSRHWVKLEVEWPVKTGWE